MNCVNEMTMKKWSSQWTQFIQLRKEAWKKIQDFNGVWTRDLAIYRCDALPTELWSHWCLEQVNIIVGSLHIFFSGFFMQLHQLRSLRRSFLHCHFIYAVHIWFISYIINIVRTCCVRLHTTANTDAKTPNIARPTMLEVVAPVCI